MRRQTEPIASRSTLRSDERLPFGLSSGVALATSATFTPANPGTVNNAAGLVMLGLGSTIEITPKGTGKVRFTLDGTIDNATTTDATAIQLAYGTGAAPANGANATGTTIGAVLTWIALTGLTTGGVPFSKSVVILGLTPGVTYWFDVQMSVTGGTGSFSV